MSGLWAVYGTSVREMLELMNPEGRDNSPRTRSKYIVARNISDEGVSHVEDWTREGSHAPKTDRAVSTVV
jgi:hypothetical protein